MRRAGSTYVLGGPWEAVENADVGWPLGDAASSGSNPFDRAMDK